VVIELKIGKFEPEFVSKMNFYLNALDEQLRRGDDRESVRIHPLRRPRRDRGSNGWIRSQKTIAQTEPLTEPRVPMRPPCSRR